MGLGTLRRHHPAQNIEAEPPFPDGDPADTWKVDQLKAYAAAHQVDLAGMTKKAEILTAIVTAIASKEPPAGTPLTPEELEAAAAAAAKPETTTTPESDTV